MIDQPPHQTDTIRPRLKRGRPKVLSPLDFARYFKAEDRPGLPQIARRVANELHIDVSYSTLLRIRRQWLAKHPEDQPGPVGIQGPDRLLGPGASLDGTRMRCKRCLEYKPFLISVREVTPPLKSKLTPASKIRRPVCPGCSELKDAAEAAKLITAPRVTVKLIRQFIVAHKTPGGKYLRQPCVSCIKAGEAMQKRKTTFAAEVEEKRLRTLAEQEHSRAAAQPKLRKPPGRPVKTTKAALLAAYDRWGSHGKAAKACGVTMPTSVRIRRADWSKSLWFLRNLEDGVEEW